MIFYMITLRKMKQQSLEVTVHKGIMYNKLDFQHMQSSDQAWT